MIDFHSHILPKVDDGPDRISESLSMLRQSFLQGVDLVVATSHFYAQEEYPKEFLKRRNRSFQVLQKAMLMSPEVYPKVIPGAEVLYFPGISDAEDVGSLTIGWSKSILIEPPMLPWSDSMLDEIVQLGQNLNCTPVIAHVDRFMQMLHDETLMDRVRQRGMVVQVNASYFVNPKTVKSAVRHLKKGDIQLIGSDCHNLDSRPPNLGLAWKQAKAFGVKTQFKQLHKNAVELLTDRRR